MSHAKRAAIASSFSYLQFALGMLTGVILFPLVIKSVGVYSYGLWLATGEAITYALLGDFGVFAVLPWLIASCLGSKNFEKLHQHVSHALAIGLVLGALLLVGCGSLFLIDPSIFGVSETLWHLVLVPTTILLICHGLLFPLRVFQALLVGVQDVTFVGVNALIQQLLTVAFTVGVIVLSSGIAGLALAAGIPPLVNGLLAAMRVFLRHRKLICGLTEPKWKGFRGLFREGFGAWLGGLGYRLMAVSNGMILLAIGRPDLATVLASTSKVATILTPLCSTIPDSGLVGISHVHASGNREATGRTVVCLLLLYLIIPSLASAGLLVANGAFVRWWIGDEMYAGNYVNLLLVLSLVVTGAAGGAVKLVSVVGHRLIVGWATLIAGLLYVTLGFVMANTRGLCGLAEASLLVWTFWLLPIGGYLLSKVYGLNLLQLLGHGLDRWLLASFPAFFVATWLGFQFDSLPMVAFSLSVVAVIVYAYTLRPLLETAPWPERVRQWLNRFSLSV